MKNYSVPTKHFIKPYTGAKNYIGPVVFAVTVAIVGYFVAGAAAIFVW